MDDKVVVEKVRTRDNLWAEEHTSESVDPVSGQKVRVRELYVEKRNPVHLQERVTEKLREDVYERTIDVVDENGTVLDRKVESVDPLSSRMQLVEHISAEDVAASMQNDGCNVTREEMVDMFVKAIEASNVNKTYGTRGVQAELEGKNESKGSGINWLTVGLGLVLLVEAGLLVWLLM